MLRSRTYPSASGALVATLKHVTERPIGTFDYEPSIRFCLADPVFMVELRGFEPLTFSLRTRRATNCATAPSRRTG